MAAASLIYLSTVKYVFIDVRCALATAKSLYVVKIMNLLLRMRPSGHCDIMWVGLLRARLVTGSRAVSMRGSHPLPYAFTAPLGSQMFRFFMYAQVNLFCALTLVGDEPFGRYLWSDVFSRRQQTSLPRI